jgi:hypothetical protein
MSINEKLSSTSHKSHSCCTHSIFWLIEMKDFVFKPTFTLTSKNGQGSLIETWYIKILRDVGFFNRVWGFLSVLNFWHNIKSENVINRHIIILLLFLFECDLGTLIITRHESIPCLHFPLYVWYSSMAIASKFDVNQNEGF